ncbi:MAG: pentapeptide repeat-containing protein [Planctomycetota bacterium]|mgnify:CR=1 FL=1
MPNEPEEKSLSASENQKQEIWKSQFLTLPAISHEEAQQKLKAGETLKGVSVPFLNFDQMIFEENFSFEDCLITGFVARGGQFRKKVEFKNCLFRERVQLNTLRQKEEVSLTTFNGNIEISRCSFEDTFTLKEAEFMGEVRIKECHFAQMVSLDKAHFHRSIHFAGPGKIAFLTMFRANIQQNLKLENYHFTGEKEICWDLNQIHVSQTFSLLNCQFDKNIEMGRASLSLEQGICWNVSECTFQKIDIRESIFHGDVNFSQVKVLGEWIADLPRESGGKKPTRPTLFKRDLAFLETNFAQKCLFHGTRFLQYVNFKHCTLDQGGVFNHAEFGQLVSFWEVTTKESVHFRKAHFSGRTQWGRVSLASRSSFNEAIFEEETSLFDSTIEGDIFFSGSYFAKSFKIRNVEFKGGLSLEKVTLQGDLVLSNCSIKDRFIATEGHFQDIQAPGLLIGTWGSLSKSVISGKILMNGLRTGTELPDIKEEPIPTEIGENSVESEKSEKVVPGTFYFSESTFHKEVHLSKSKIKGQLCFDQVNSYSEMDLTNLGIGHDLILSKSYFRGLMRLDATRCREVVSMKARYKEEVSFNQIQCQKFSVNASSFDGGFTLRSADIERTLTMNQVDVDGKIDMFQCKYQKIYFRNLIVDHFLINREAIGDRLTSELSGNYPQAQNEYGILKRAFLQQSQYKDMDWAYYRFCRSARKSKKISLKKPLRTISIFLDWLLLDLGFGYGTRPMNIGGVALGIILIFATIFYGCPHGFIDGGEMPLLQVSFLQATYLSVVSFALMDYGNFFPSFLHWIKYVVALEGLFGIFLTTLFVATISRKIIRT